MSISLPSIEATLGAQFVGIFINTYLYGVVSYQYASYFSSKTFKDPLWIKLLVLLLCLLDTFHTISLLYLGWRYLIQDFGNRFAMLTGLIWPYPMTVAVVACTAFLTQLFLSYRILRLTNKYVFAALLLISLSSLSIGLVTTVKSFRIATLPDNLNEQLISLKVVMTAWFSIEVGTDVLLAGTLIIYLSRSRTGFSPSNTIINRLMRTAIQSGFLTTVFSILALLFFLNQTDTMYYTIFAFPISRLYSNTVMDSLLCRDALRGIILSQSDPRTLSTNSVQLAIRKDIHREVQVDNPDRNHDTRRSTVHLKTWSQTTSTELKA